MQTQIGKHSQEGFLGGGTAKEWEENSLPLKSSHASSFSDLKNKIKYKTF